MGIFDTVFGAVNGNRAYRTHVNGNKLANEGKPSEAEAKYREAMVLYETSVRQGNAALNILQAYAILLLRTGEFEKAREMMEEISKMKTLSKDNWFDLRIQYSIYQWKTGRLDDAIETMGRAAQYRKNGLVYSTMGMYMVDKAKQSGDFTSALKYNEEAMEYDDEDASTLDNMAQLYEAMAEHEEDNEKAHEYLDKALDFYKRAHTAKPRQITTIYYLARMYHHMGEDDKARKLLSVRNTLYFSAVCPVTKDMMEDLAKEIG